MAKEDLNLTDILLKKDQLTFVMKSKDGEEREMRLKFINNGASEFCYNTLSWSLKDESIMGEKKLDEMRLESVEIREDDMHGSRPYMLCKEFLEKVVEKVNKQNDVKYYAQELNITPSYLFVVVRQFTGKSPSDIIASYIISNAKQLLECTNMNCKLIASELNFANQSFFGKFFKKHTGMTPVEFRKQNRKNFKKK